jgi:hypothetical protein
MKYLSVMLLALALAACDLGASSPSAEPLPSIGAASMAADHSMGDGMSMEPAGSADCADAFGDLDLADLADLTDLDAASDALDDTIAGCGSVADWEGQLATALPMLSLDDADAFLAARCAANATLADSAICVEVGA